MESNANSRRKRVRTGKDVDVEKALVEWVKNARQQDIPISGPILTEKAKHLATQMNKPDFTPTNGWLERWKDRNNIVYKKIHGEKKDPGIPVADNRSKIVLPDIPQNRSPDNIYNEDETGIYDRDIPDETKNVRCDNAAGSKKTKECTITLVAVNKQPCINLPTNENLCAPILLLAEKADSQDANAANSDDEEVRHVVRPTAEELLSALTTIRRGLEFGDTDNYSHFYYVEDQVSALITKMKRQSVKTEFFQWCP
jgi:hypothetical protein